MKKIFYFLSKYLLFFISDTLFSNILFFINCVRLNKNYYVLKPKLKRTFNENILCIKNENIELKACFADKVNVVSELKKLTNDINSALILEVFSNKKELYNFDFELLRESGFVIKANHGSGLNKIYKKGECPSLKDLKSIKNWFKFDSSVLSREKHYRLIEKKVFIEELLSENILDFKFHCFRGKAKFIQVDFDRFIEHKRNIYDVNWNLQNFKINYSTSNLNYTKPNNFDEMISLAEKVAKIIDFSDYIRVDLYDNNGIIYLGEITFHPGGGVEPFDSYESDLFMGSFIKN